MHRTLRKIRDRIARPDLYFSVREAAARVPPRMGEPGTVVAVTSSREREGKTFVSLALAVQAAESGEERVLLVDGNAGDRRSASTILSSGGVTAGRDADMGLPTTWPSLDVLSIETDGTGAAPYAALADLTSQARTLYDLTILDLPSLSEGGRLFGMIRCADGVVFVVEHRRFSITQVRSYASNFPRIGVEVFGTVLNKRRYPIPKLIYNWL